MPFRPTLFSILFFAMTLYMIAPSIAQKMVDQNAYTTSETTDVSSAKTATTNIPLKTPTLSIGKNEPDASGIQSLFFTKEALALIRDAIEGLNAGSSLAGSDSDKDPGIRELALGGIVFKSKEDWTIWLNGRRITPKTIPGEILNLDVTKEYIDIKWFDNYTNQIFPVRLRINERFNLDTRLFLSGPHSEDQQL